MCISRWIWTLKHIPLTILSTIMNIWTVNHMKKKKNKNKRKTSQWKTNSYVRSLIKKWKWISFILETWWCCQRTTVFFLVYEKTITPGQAAKKQLGVNRRTAYNWIKKDQENPSDTLELNNGRKMGRLSILNKVHKKHFISF